MSVVISKGNATIGQGQWSPQTDWVNLGTVANNEILLLTSDIGLFYSVNVTVTGGYTVDWGDGTVSNYTSGSEGTHTYTLGAGTVCALGYTTWRARIYAQVPANSITRFAFGTGKITQNMNGTLWAKLGTTGLTSLASGFYGNIYCVSQYIQCVELPSSLVNCISYSAMLNNCVSLQKIVMPYTYSSSAINFNGAFAGCYVLKSIDYHATSLNISSMQIAHYVNYNLKSCILPTTINGCSSWNQTFYQCWSLSNVTLPTINTNCNADRMFYGCTNMDTIIFNSSWDNRVTTFGTTFNGCFLLRNLTLPANGNLSGAFLTNTFTNCYTLKTITYPTNNSTAITDITAVHAGDWNVETINNFPAMNNVTVMSAATLGAFQYCYRLKTISNLDQLGDTTTGFDHTLTYSGCYSLPSLSCRNKITGRFILSGISASQLSALSSLVFTNPSAVSTWAGSSPQIDVAYGSMNAAALNTLFTSIISTSASFSGKVIRITGNPGAATCDTTIITAAGGTVNKLT